MNRMKVWLTAGLIAVCLIGCGKSESIVEKSGNSVDKVLEEQSQGGKDQKNDSGQEEAEQQKKNELIPEESSGSDTSVDYDLTEMNSDMVYATVYQLMMDPDKYVGKTFKIDGSYYSGQDEETSTVYHYCVIKDALACCAQGLEFVVEDKDASDKVEYPEEETEIEVKGTFETYKESGDDTLYCRIANAEMEVK